MYSAAVILRAAIALLCAAATLEWLVPAAAPHVPPPREHLAIARLQPAPARGQAAGQYAAAILARPLFSQHRRPPAEPSRPAGVDADLPRLSGIMIAGLQKHAIFEGDGKPKVTAIGGQVGDYRVLAITPSAVTVAGPHGTERVSLSFDAAKRSVVTSPFSGPGLLYQFHTQAPISVPVPQPPTMEQMMARLPRAAQ